MSNLEKNVEKELNYKEDRKNRARENQNREEVKAEGGSKKEQPSLALDKGSKGSSEPLLAPDQLSGGMFAHRVIPLAQQLTPSTLSMTFKMFFDVRYKNLIITSETQEIVFSSESAFGTWGIKSEPEINFESIIHKRCEAIANILDRLSPAGKKNPMLGEVLLEHFGNTYIANSMLDFLNQLTSKLKIFLACQRGGASEDLPAHAFR